MDAKLVLSYFPTHDQDGRALHKIFVPAARKLGFTVKEHWDATIKEYTQACWNDDVVVLDGTVTGRGFHNYELAIPTPIDHVLVVSRTYLPINFYGLRDAIFDREAGTLIYGAPFYPGSLSNEELLRWLYLQLLDMLPALPRSKQEKGVFGSMFRGMSKSLNAVDQRRRQSGQIFISYRSNDWSEVKLLKRRIESGEFHGGQPVAVRCFPPNTLSDEVMTEQRRWQMLSMIDRFIGPAEEIWAFESENYYDSWWTVGELATLTYRREDGFRGERPPKLRIFKPKEDNLDYAPADYLPQMSKEQRHRMARWFANCDTAQMSAEAIVVMRLLGQLPLIGQLNYLQDHVWTEEFWQHPILDCKKCRQIGKQRNWFDFDAFLWTQDPGFSRFTPEEIETYISQGQITCRHCGTSYRTVEGSPQYLYLPVINGHRTGEYLKALFNVLSKDPDEHSLVPLQTYRIL